MCRMDGDDIRRLREARGLTQEQLAAAVGVGARTVGNWERGETIPKNRMGALREFFRIDEQASDPLSALSDVALISELLRRAVSREGHNRNHGAG